MSEPPEKAMTAAEVRDLEQVFQQCTMSITVRMPGGPMKVQQAHTLNFNFDFNHMRHRLASRAALRDTMLADAIRENQVRGDLREYLMDVAAEIIGPMAAHFASLNDHFYGDRAQPSRSELQRAIAKGLMPTHPTQRHDGRRYPKEFDDL